jgi:O-acetyl-ADP-ribose deacetylase (regulator of RNase III)
MIEHRSGNLLYADAEALVNSVNTVGVMGKGVALQFKQAFPENFKAYERACRHQEVRPGKIFVFETGSLTNPRFILNFPTKRHWRGRSKLEDIDAGLKDLRRVLIAKGIKSVALPPLGCGNGGLDWATVLPRIEEALADLHGIGVYVFAPEGAPAPSRMPVRTLAPRLTRARAALLAILRAYAEPGFRLTMLEIQKLAYLLQESGEPLKLDFGRGTYGPYAEALQFVLQRLEGHYIRGYGDRSGETDIHLTADATPAANTILESNPRTAARLAKVTALIEGFETPYGLELLTTVHYLAKEAPADLSTPEAAIRKLHSWSVRKRNRFTPEHVRVAWHHLANQNWLPGPGEPTPHGV